jgi:hypothetical protein
MLAVGGPGGDRRWRGPRVRLHRPTGIRNGGLLLVLVLLAGIMALVDKPPQPGRGGRLPGILQYLPPPVGISQPLPTIPQPPAVEQVAGGGRLESVARSHPRSHRPDRGRAGSPGGRRGHSASRAADDQAGTSRPGPGGPPPATGRPADGTVSVSVQVPATAVRVAPPKVLGGGSAAQVTTPGVRADLAVPP